MMKKIIVFMSLFFVSLPLMATCKTGGYLAQTFSFKNAKLLSDPSVPVGTVLATRTAGGNITGAGVVSGCSASDIYLITSSPVVNEAIGVKGVKGGPVYETGIPGIGFEISELIAGTITNPTPATLNNPVDANSIGSYTKVQQMTVWLIKTKDVIDTSVGGGKIVVKFSAGPSNLIPKDSTDVRLFWATIDLGPFIEHKTSCDINPRGGSTINLQPVDLTLLKSTAQGAITGKQKDFTLDITCPNDSVGMKYTYWFNAITDASSAKDGVLLNSINESSGGAKNVGLIVKHLGKPIKFFDYDDYSIAKTSNSQSLNFTADYYKVDNDISAGTVRGMMEVIIQEE